MNYDRYAAKREAETLDDPVTEARDLATRLGLDPYPVRYWVVDHDEMNQLIAYEGFQRRYPHWRWGMNYDRQRKKDQHGLGKAFEIVNNDDPAHAFLQESNTLADQKAVITHVEAHADFFANNRWFGLYADRGSGGPDAAARLERHADAIEEYMSDPDVERADVERLIDAVLCLSDTIDQHRALGTAPESSDAVAGIADDDETSIADVRERLDELGLSDEVREQVFDAEWIDAQANTPGSVEPAADVLAFLRDHGKRYDEEEGKAVEREDWETDVIDMLREEAYYFAGQKLTKVMNEGWAAFWESLMMADEGFADQDELFTYADHMAKVLGSSGLNPYKLGMELWKHVEVTTARKDVVDRLLRVEGITPTNFHDELDFEEIADLLAPDDPIDGAGPEHLEELAALAADGDARVDAENVELAIGARDGTLEDDRAGEAPDAERHPWKLLTYEGLAERHYALARPESRNALRRIERSELERRARYMFDVDRFDSPAEALADVDYTAPWDRMREVRASHNDVTFIDEFLSDEFVRENGYFTYEYAHGGGQFRVASVDADDVRKKLLLQFTNFGKPTIVVYDGNFDNRGELLLGHQYNGVALNEERAKATLERVFELWGRPVNLMTIRTEYADHELEIARRRDREPAGEEVGVRIRYDGENFTEHGLDEPYRERIEAIDVDYDTKPDDWLA